MFPSVKFEDYLAIAQHLLTPPGADSLWNSHVKSLVKNAEFKDCLRRLFSINTTVANLKQMLALAIALNRNSEELFNEDHLKAIVDEQMGDSEPVILAGLTVIETCMLVAIKHLQTIYEGQAFNFEMAYHEYDKFVSTKAKMLKQDRRVLMKAWEMLIELEIITPVDRGTKIQKEFKLHWLQVLPETILKTMDTMPQSVQEWAKSIAYAS